MKQKQQNFRSQSGAGVVEFLITFPMFLILCLFLVELTFICIDRHVIKLASFEAARALSLGAKSDQNYNPCDDRARLKKAKNTAYKRIAAIAPTVDLILAKSGMPVPADTTEESKKVAQTDVLKYFLRRWPSAVVLTEFQCSFDATYKLVTMKIDYNRILATPVINRIVFYIRQAQIMTEKSNGKNNYDLDDNFMHLTGSFQNPLKQKNIQNIVPFLKDLPGMSVFSFTDKIEETVNSLVTSETNLVNEVLEHIPEVLWQLPLSATSTVAVGVKPQGSKVEDRKLITPHWSGLLPGAISLTGDHRKWAKALSAPSNYLNHDPPKAPTQASPKPSTKPAAQASPKPSIQNSPKPSAKASTPAPTPSQIPARAQPKEIK